MALDNNIMNWDDTIENDGQEFVVLPEGDYTFTVGGAAPSARTTDLAISQVSAKVKL